VKQHTKTLALLVLLHASSIYAPQLIIAQSGTHILDISRSYAPSAANDTIIQIDASNVVLDLKGKLIDQRSDNTQGGLDGITISPLVSEVTIQNANIKNITGVGIRVGNACTKINILDSKIESCASGGILLNGSTPGVIGCTIRNATITSCTGYGGNPAYGIRVIKGNTVAIYDSALAFNDAVSTSSGYGISIENSSNCAVFNTTVGRSGGSGIAAGIAVIASSDILLQEDAVYRSTAYTGTAYGYMIEQCSSVLSTKCRSSVNTGLSFSSYGFALQNGQKNVIEDLISGFNTSAQLTAGILFNNESQSIVINSNTRGNATTITGTAYGILLTGTCDKCSIDTNKIINNSGASETFGIADTREQSTSMILGNIAFNNATNFSVTYTDIVELPVTDASLSDFPGTADINASNAYMNISITP
jgi:hypothetical protein